MQIPAKGKTTEVERMTYPTPTYATFDDWIAREAIPFSLDSPRAFSTAVDKVAASLGDEVELLGLGEALHGGEDILVLRNRLFQHLVEAHDYSAIAIESSFSRAHLVNEYVAGRGPTSYEAMQDTGFSHGFGHIVANRELVEWMRHYNVDPMHRIKLQFYGFDSPTEMMGSDSPRQILHFVLDYLASIDEALSQHYRSRIDQLLGPDAVWENPAATMDPTQSIGLEPAAAALRLETEELIADLQVRRPELVTKSNERRYLEALQYAVVARQLLNYHAALARDSSDRVARLLGMRDALMADNLAYMVARERDQGKVLAFAHNSHLQRGKAALQLGSDVYTWWPVGAHLHEMLGSCYAVIGSAVGESLANGIGQPGPVRFLPTHRGQRLLASAMVALPTRSGSVKNPTYFALTSQSLIDFDWLVVLDSTAYSRGGPPLSDVSTSAKQ
jgi:erythromycin esterase